MKYSLIVLFLLMFIGGAVLLWRSHRYDEPGNIAPAPTGTATAYFAGGCFWCTESDFEKLNGVSEVISGYSGGTTSDPSYVSVSSHTTGHVETVEVRYDPTVITYQTLVSYFFSHIDPTDPAGQFADQGESYRSVIFYRTLEEKNIVDAEKERLTKSGAYEKPIVTSVIPFEKFYPAEEYHQNYWKKNPTRYSYYRRGSGRDQYLKTACQIRTEKNVPCLDAKELRN